MIVNLSIFPIGKGESVGRFVAEAVREIVKSGLDYRLTPMGTLLEGEWDPVMKLVGRIRKKILKTSGRIYITLSIDERKGRKGLMQSKVRSVENILGHPLRK